MKIKLLALVAAAALLSGTALLSSTLSNAESNTVKVCVNKTTKAVYYRSKCKTSESTLTLTRNGNDGLSAYQLWQAAGNTGTESDFLNSLKGTPGQPGSNAKDAWSNLTDCQQKLQQASTFGINLSFKKYRQKFENLTECTIENINSSNEFLSKDLGLPYVSNVKFLSYDPEYSEELQGYYANYEIEINNADATSAIHDSPSRFCTFLAAHNGTFYHQDLVHVSGNKYQIKLRLAFSRWGVIADGGIMYYTNGVCHSNMPNASPYLGYVTINVDPTRFLNASWLHDYLQRRGWIQ